MKALTIRQPWASLIAVGAKTLETRSWSTTYRGPLAVHAGLYYEDNAETLALAQHLFKYDEPGVWKVPCDPPMARGAVVASCQLIDVVPIVDWHGCKDGSKHLCVVNENALLHSALDEPWPDGETERIVSDQLPFGDFTPGRFAWLLGDVKPTTERCPACWGTGIMHWQCPRHGLWTDEDELQQVQPDGHNACPLCEEEDDLVAFDCVTCKTDGKCDPVPAKGRQGLWSWTPETVAA